MAEESKNDDGQLTKSDNVEAEAKTEAKEGEGEKPKEPDPKEVISELQKSEDVREDQRHNLNAGLAKMQDSLGEMRRELAEIKQAGNQPQGQRQEEDPFGGLPDGEDIADAAALKKGLRVVDDRARKRFDKFSEDFQKTIDQLKQQPAAVAQMSSQQQIDIVKNEFDIQDDYAAYIITQAGPKIDVLDRENPNMTTGARDMLVRSVLEKELNTINKAVAQRQESKDSKMSKTTDPKDSTVSTKVTQDGASSVTFANTTSDPPLNQADSKESMVRKLVELRAAGG